MSSEFNVIENIETDLDMCISVLAALGSNPCLSSMDSAHLYSCLALVTEKLEAAKTKVMLAA